MHRRQWNCWRRALRIGTTPALGGVHPFAGSVAGDGLPLRFAAPVVNRRCARRLGAMARRLAKKTAELTGLGRATASRAMARIEVDRRWLGRGYGYSTRDSAQVMTNGAPLAQPDLSFDPAYTAKAFACALDLAKSGGRTILYWHTLSSAPMEPLLVEASELPPDLARLFVDR